MFDTVLDREKDEYDCKAPGCQDESVRSLSFADVGTLWFCHKHWQKAARFRQRDELERYCEGPDCGLRLTGEAPLDQLYCSKHCANNAERVRQGLEPSVESGPISSEERFIRAARREAESRGLTNLPLYRRDSAWYQDIQNQYGPGQGELPT